MFLLLNCFHIIQSSFKNRISPLGTGDAVRATSTLKHFMRVALNRLQDGLRLSRGSRMDICIELFVFSLLGCAWHMMHPVYYNVKLNLSILASLHGQFFFRDTLFSWLYHSASWKYSKWKGLNRRPNTIYSVLSSFSEIAKWRVG